MSHGEIGIYNQREIRKQKKTEKVKSAEIKDGSGETINFDFNNDGKTAGEELKIKEECYDLKQKLQHENIQKTKKQNKLNKKIEKLKQQILAGKDINSFLGKKNIAKLKKELAILEAKKEMLEKEFIAEEAFINDNFENILNFAKEKYSTKKTNEQELREEIEAHTKKENTLNPCISSQKSLDFVSNEKDSVEESMPVKENSFISFNENKTNKTNELFNQTSENFNNNSKSINREEIQKRITAKIQAKGISEEEYYEELVNKAANSLNAINKLPSIPSINSYELKQEIAKAGGVKNLSITQIMSILDMAKKVTNPMIKLLLKDAISDTEEFLVLQEKFVKNKEEQEKNNISHEVINESIKAEELVPVAIKEIKAENKEKVDDENKAEIEFDKKVKAETDIDALVEKIIKEVEENDKKVKETEEKEIFNNILKEINSIVENNSVYNTKNLMETNELKAAEVTEEKKVEVKADEPVTSEKQNTEIKSNDKMSILTNEENTIYNKILEKFVKKGMSEVDYYDELAAKAKNSIPMLEPLSAMFSDINIKGLVKEVNETGVKNLSLEQIQKVTDMLNAVKSHPNAAGFQSMLNDAISDTKEFFVLQKIRLAKSESGEKETVQAQTAKDTTNLPNQVTELSEKSNIPVSVQKIEQTAKEEEIRQRITKKLSDFNYKEEDYYRKLLINTAANLKETYMLDGIIPDANIYPLLKIAGDIGSTEKLTPEEIQLMINMANSIKDRPEVKELLPVIENAISNMEELLVLQKKQFESIKNNNQPVFHIDDRFRKASSFAISIPKTAKERVAENMQSWLKKTPAFAEERYYEQLVDDLCTPLYTLFPALHSKKADVPKMAQYIKEKRIENLTPEDIDLFMKQAQPIYVEFRDFGGGQLMEVFLKLEELRILKEKRRSGQNFI